MPWIATLGSWCTLRNAKWAFGWGLLGLGVVGLCVCTHGVGCVICSALFVTIGGGVITNLMCDDNERLVKLEEKTTALETEKKAA